MDSPQALKTPYAAPETKGIGQFIPLSVIIPVTAMIFTRLFLLVVAVLANRFLPERASENNWHAAPENLLLDIWARWDSGFYLSIAQNGYSYVLGEQSSVAFFPIYPLLIKLLSWLHSPVMAGVIVSNACLLLGLIYLYKLTKLELGDAAARRSVIYLTLFPASFFFSAVYTESTFFLFAVMSFYYARTQRWGMASVAGMLASSTRIVGIIQLGIVGLEWLRAHGWTLSTCLKPEAWRNLAKALRYDFKSLLGICMIPMGLISYMLFLGLNFADPVAFFTVQAAWQRETLGPILILWRDLSNLINTALNGGVIYWVIILDVSALVLGIVAGIAVWRRLGASYGLFVILSLVIPLSSATQSILRYLVVLFPVFMMLAQWGKNKSLDAFIRLTFTSLLALCFAFFVNWYFIA